MDFSCLLTSLVRNDFGDEVLSQNEDNTEFSIVLDEFSRSGVHTCKL